MFNVNPMQLIQMIKSGSNPQQLMLSILENNFAGTPMGDNLLNLVKQNKTQDIEKVVRNVCAQKGLDFDQEFLAFKQKLGL